MTATLISETRSTDSSAASKTARTGERKTGRGGRHRGSIGTTIAIAVGALIFIVPLALMVLTAFKTPAEAAAVPPSILPKEPTLGAFQAVLTQAPFLIWMRNSVFVAVIGTTLTIFTSSIAGYTFAKFKFRGRRIAFPLVLAGLMVPFPVILIPTYLVANALGILNTIWALLMPFVVSSFGVFLMRQFAQSIPDDVLDAARVDGAGEWRIYFKIALPLLSAPAAALGVFTFLAAWNDYLWPLVAINDENLNTLPLGLSYFNSAHVQRQDIMMAVTTLSILPVFVIFAVFQKRIVASLALSGMK